MLSQSRTHGFRPAAGLVGAVLWLAGCTIAGEDGGAAEKPESLVIATFNIQDIRTEQLENLQDERLKAAAKILQDIRPDILFVNEIAADHDEAGQFIGSNGTRFARSFLAVSQGDSSEPLHYDVFMAPSNTGIHSGHDLNNDGNVSEAPGTREYGGDCLGYGAFPGQYGMALFVREGLQIQRDDIRTFRTFLWKDMPDALLPPGGDASDAEGWYSDEELAILPLSSKSHWDVPVRLEDGAVIHVLCSHPTPPVFDGPEDRNGRRNHDEIRFWLDYVSGAAYITDDLGEPGGLPTGASFVIMGDLNADPQRGDSLNNPIGRLLLAHPRIQSAPIPVSTSPPAGSRAEQTSGFGLRVDYVLASDDLTVLDAGVYRGPQDAPTRPTAEPRKAGSPSQPEAPSPSDHFPVWIRIAVPE